MIDAQGWLDWAIRLPGPLAHTNAGTNPVNGIFMHSAEGYGYILLDPASEYGYNGNHSWHLTNLFDGTLYQHYPLTARCWHATAANNEYIGVENEGDYPTEASLTDAQVATAVRFIGEIAAWKGWEPRRPSGPTDLLATLYEHREVMRFGGSATACPSGRIPWQTILERLGGDDMSEEDKAKIETERLRRLVHRTLDRDDYAFVVDGQDPATGEWIINVLSGVGTDDAIRIRVR